MKKSFVLILTLLVLALLCAGIGFSAMAAEPDGVNSLEQKLMSGYEVTAQPVGAMPISSSSAFTSMAANGTYYLTTDITVSQQYPSEFKGNLYGNGHTVTITFGKPLFDKLNGATVCDITIVGAISQYANYVGGLAAEARGSTLTGITNKANLHNSKSQQFAGGVVGYAENTTLKYCVNYGNITGNPTAFRPGGIVGQMNSETGTLTLENCINHGSVAGVNQTGGLVSRVENGAALTIKNSANFGTVTVSGSDSGGIIGKVTNAATVVEFRGCYNSGHVNGGTITGGILGCGAPSKLTVVDCHNGCFVDGCSCKGTDHGYLTQKKPQDMGGIIASFWNLSAEAVVTDCTNTGKIVCLGQDEKDHKFRAGGITACLEAGKLTVKNCHNYGDIQNGYYGAGVFARVGVQNDTLLTIEDCSNAGNVNITAHYAGGIVAYQQNSTNLLFKNCQNSGKITATGWASGIMTRMDNRLGKGTVTFQNCTNSGDVKGNAVSGGICAYIWKCMDTVTALTYIDCTNTGNLTSPNYLGGLVGIADVGGFDASNCRNSGSINIVNLFETGNVGGLVGRTYGASTFTDCVNTGNIIEAKTIGTAGPKTLYVGGIVGWVGQSGDTTEYKEQTATFTNCLNIGNVVAEEALNADQVITAGGIVGVSRSTCYAEFCVVAGKVCGTCQVGGICALASQNKQSGSTFMGCVVLADLYNNAARISDRTHGIGGIACYIWGDAHVSDCTVMGNLQFDLSGSDLVKENRRPLSALIGYTNNSGGEFKYNFFGGKLISGEGTDCIKVMCAYTVACDVTEDETVDIYDNYSFQTLPLHYNDMIEYSTSNTPELTAEQIAQGLTLADLMMETNLSMVAVMPCSGVKTPIHVSTQANYNLAVEATAHPYIANCDTHCATCGREKLVLTHSYVNVCDTVCTVCGNEREVSNHEYGTWTVLKPAAVGVEGLRERECSVCGYKETEVLSALVTLEDDKGFLAIFENKTVLIGVIAGAAALVIVIVVIVVVAKKKKKNKVEDAVEEQSNDGDFTE